MDKIVVHQYEPDGRVVIEDPNGEVLIDVAFGEVYYKTVLKQLGYEIEEHWHIDSDAIEREIYG